MNKIRIGTRGSRLALRQAAMVQEAIRQADSGLETEIVVLHTKGDKILDKPLAEIGDKGVFVSEFEQALLAGEIDLAVHSAKDLPMTLAKGLTIAAVLPRGDVRDVLVIPRGGRVPGYVGGIRDACENGDGAGAEIRCSHGTLENKKDSRHMFVIGSGSRRRRQQASELWENVICENIRGNIDTRLQKLKNSSRSTEDHDRNIEYTAQSKTGKIEIENNNVANYDGLILAKAGLDRLEIPFRYEDEFEFYPLSPERFLPAACQGIIAVETLQDSEIAALCRKVTDADTEFSFLVEREVLAQLAADCSDAAAVWCRLEQGSIILDVMYAGNRQRLTCKTDCSMETTEAKKETRLQLGLAMAKEAAVLVKGR